MEFFKENPLCRARSSLLASIFATLHGPKIIVTAIYKNHLGQHYRSVLQAYLLPLPWNETSPTGVQLERNAGVEFDFDDMQPEEYMPNVLLRSHSVVKTGRVVKRDTEEYGVYGGNPAVLEGVRQIG